MYTEFDQLHFNSKIWIYQSDRKLSDNEVMDLSAEIIAFLESWKAHGNDLKASFKILFEHFMVIGVDERHNSTSGCSIDASVHFIKQMEGKYKVSFFDRSKIAFLINGKTCLEDLSKIKEKVNSGVIHAETMTFINLIDRKEFLDSQWLVPAASTWMKRFFKKSTSFELNN
ncbi:MAG: hypothetical protein JJU28_22150 [Cyclobacteriaceae bacterium]|nr:hypothetical protein [Cyclobacteriaceae bacterium]